MDRRRFRRRRALGLSQQEIASQLGIPRSEVSEMEAGKRLIAARGVTLANYEALLDRLEAEREAMASRSAAR